MDAKLYEKLKTIALPETFKNTWTMDYWCVKSADEYPYFYLITHRDSGLCFDLYPLLDRDYEVFTLVSDCCKEMLTYKARGSFAHWYCDRCEKELPRLRGVRAVGMEWDETLKNPTVPTPEDDFMLAVFKAYLGAPLYKEQLYDFVHWLKAKVWE